MPRIALLFGLGMTLCGGVLLARPADGDPLEEYDYSGRVSLDQFLERTDEQVYVHGLWTVQRVTRLDPFAGKTWDLKGNATERVNVYFGTRPLWCSDEDYRVQCRVPGSEDLNQPESRWRNPDGSLSELRLCDLTGENALTLWLDFWNGGVNGGWRHSLIRLEGSTPAEAKVRVLYEGRGDDVVDLDGDGVVEIVDFDEAHVETSYLPWKGWRATTILAWDEYESRYVVANDRLYAQSRARWREQQNDTAWSEPELDWAREQFDSAQLAVQRYREAGTRERRERERLDALFHLSGAITVLIWGGRLDLAERLLHESPLDDYSPHARESSRDPRVTREEWWKLYREGCERSKYWSELCRVFPQLARR